MWVVLAIFFGIGVVLVGPKEDQPQPPLPPAQHVPAPTYVEETPSPSARRVPSTQEVLRRKAGALQSLCDAMGTQSLPGGTFTFQSTEKVPSGGRSWWTFGEKVLQSDSFEVPVTVHARFELHAEMDQAAVHYYADQQDSMVLELYIPEPVQRARHEVVVDSVVAATPEFWSQRNLYNDGQDASRQDRQACQLALQRLKSQGLSAVPVSLRNTCWRNLTDDIQARLLGAMNRDPATRLEALNIVSY